MISEKDKNKLKHIILTSLYKKYDSTNSLENDDFDLAVYTLYGYDPHDIDIALKSLKADGFVDLQLNHINENVSKAILTQEGINFCQKQRERTFKNYLITNHLSIIDLFLSSIAIIISIIALYYSLY